MSEENIELAHRAWGAVRKRDLDAFLALMDPEVVAVPRILAVEGGALHGHDGIRRWWESIFGVFPDFDAEVIGIRGVGEVTISNVQVRGRGQGSDTPFEDAIWVVSQLRDGKVVRWQTYGSETEALEAADLSN
ncbi:MAG: nuclear transport factor 2 family protein [Solirubrobacterales bacterium]